MDVQAEVRLLRWLRRELYPHVSRTAPTELLTDVERALLRVAYDPQGGPITFARRQVPRPLTPWSS